MSIEESKDLSIDQIPIKHLWIGNTDLLQMSDVKILGQHLSNKEIRIDTYESKESLDDHDSLLQYRWGFKVITANNTDQDAWLNFAKETLLQEDPSKCVYPIVQFNDGSEYKCLTMGYNEDPFMVMLISMPFTS